MTSGAKRIGGSLKQLRVMTIIGTRPEAVKMAPVVLELRQRRDIFTAVCTTAQHRQMLDQVLNLFDIKPNIDLDLMKPNQTLSEMTAAVFLELDPILTDLRPDWILVQGDTTTVMAASLVAFYNQIKIGHVEAGLRTNDKMQPFPEEINRRVAGVVADLHFSPTEWARQNLLREGVPNEQVYVTGNPVIDALKIVSEMPPTEEVKQLLDRFGLADENNRKNSHRVILVTAHRRENFGQPLEDICQALLQLSKIYGDNLSIIYPVHLNPNVQEPVKRILGNSTNIHLLPPLDYLPLVHLMKRATIILTDSGGIQEEAPGLGVPVLVLRNVTERPEGIQAGTVKLVGSETQSIVTETRRLLDDKHAHDLMAQSVNPYGDGFASRRIVDALINYKYLGMNSL